MAVFAGSAALSLLAVIIGQHAGLVREDAPEWAWIAGVLLVDVAHVYATVFRVYADPEELSRAPLRYTVLPVCGLLIGIALYAAGGERLFWRALAYMAVFHFVRQQYGWVALYRARLGERSAWGRRIDSLAIHMAAIYPLLYWHAHLPRRFWWFVNGDFITLPVLWDPVLRIARIAYVGSLLAYTARAVLQHRRGFTNPGKHMVVLTTAMCWYVGIVALDSDYAFTVTNVLIHGIPYLALIYAYGRDREQHPPRPGLYRLFRQGPLAFLALLWLAAFIEEMLWDRAVWHARPEIFGGAWHLNATALTVVVPLLALPQLVHYLLDGFVWRRRSAPFMARLLASDAPPQS